MMCTEEKKRNSCVDTNWLRDYSLDFAMSRGLYRFKLEKVIPANAVGVTFLFCLCFFREEESPMVRV